MKVKESITIDEELSKWIKNQNLYPSASEFINNILLREFQNQNNPFYKLRDIEFREAKLNEERERVLESIKQICEEGSKKEREEAEKELKLKEEFEKKKRMEIQETIKDFYILVNNLGLNDNLLEINSYADLSELVQDMAKHDFNNNKGINSSRLIKMGGILTKILEDLQNKQKEVLGK